MNNLLDYCEVWSLALSAHPSHSRLYALEPIGMGTPNVESLTSYITRLADAHSVSLRTLAIHELLPLLKRAYLSNRSGDDLDSLWKETARALNGTGILARDWAQALECLTLRPDLRYLTFLSWAAVLTPQRQMRFNRAWCPDCFIEWQATGQPIYEPLLWNVTPVSLCLRHQRALVEQCPYPDCHTTLPMLAVHFHPGYCSKCSRWLGVTTDTSNISWTTEQWHWQIWVTETIGELILHNKDLSIVPHLENIPELIRASREQVADDNMQNLAEKLQLSRRTLNAWKLGRQIPQIESLMRLCYCCGVSLYDLFTLKSGTLDFGKLKPRSLPDIPNPTKNRRQRIPFDTVSIQQRLEDVLVCEEQPPPSMRTVAKRLNYSPRELRKHFYELGRAISTRRQNYYKVCHEQKFQQLKNEVRQATLKIHSQGLYPRSEKVRSLLSDPAAMRDPAISKIWHEILEELKKTE